MLLLQHQSIRQEQASWVECQPGVDPYSRLKYQLFLESERGELTGRQGNQPTHPGNSKYGLEPTTAADYSRSERQSSNTALDFSSANANPRFTRFTLIAQVQDSYLHGYHWQHHPQDTGIALAREPTYTSLTDQ